MFGNENAAHHTLTSELQAWCQSCEDFFLEGILHVTCPNLQVEAWKELLLFTSILSFVSLLQIIFILYN